MNELFNERIIITKEQSKTNVIIPINVDKDYEKLIIEYSYSPKFTTDEEICKKEILEAIDKYEIENKNWKDFAPIGNLITVSLDDENGEYLGCAHNQKAENRYIIAKGKSSLGFYPKEIKKGIYKVVLNIHLVLFEDVKYDLKVFGE